VSAWGRTVAAASEFANRHGIYLGRRSTRLHVALYRRTGGRFANHIPGWPAARIALVDHVGAKSGRERTSPLMYQEDGDAIVVIASKAGQPSNPG
jgi:F420H(2)-dependent quinone reductase